MGEAVFEYIFVGLSSVFVLTLSVEWIRVDLHIEITLIEKKKKKLKEESVRIVKYPMMTDPVEHIEMDCFMAQPLEDSNKNVTATLIS